MVRSAVVIVENWQGGAHPRVSRRLQRPHHFSIIICGALKFQLHSGPHEARQGAASLCSFAAAGQTRPMDMFASVQSLLKDLFMGWLATVPCGHHFYSDGSVTQSCAGSLAHTLVVAL